MVLHKVLGQKALQAPSPKSFRYLYEKEKKGSWKFAVLVMHRLKSCPCFNPLEKKQAALGA